MQKLPKIGLPIILLVIVLLIFASKSSINIGYGEAGVLFKTFGGGVVTDEPTLGEGFHIILPGTECTFIMSNNKNFSKETCKCFLPMDLKFH